MRFLRIGSVPAITVVMFTGILCAQTPPVSPPPQVRRQDRVEVVATRVLEEPAEVPQAIEVITGAELRDRGITDLKSALALAAGVSIAPGGDGGPAGAVPEFYGLREFDAFLLVVDGVPWGGAFNPALAALSLEDIDRIEILRGPAPVTFGATSFVGAIHVVHRIAAHTPASGMLRGGSFGSGGGSFSTRLPLSQRWDSRLTVDADRLGFRDDRTSYRRAHALWRNAFPLKGGKLWFSMDGLWLDQDPASPHPREGRTLSQAVPLDANHNPDGAFLNERRWNGIVGFDRLFGRATWTTSASLSLSRRDILRGFLTGMSDAPENARGFREKIDMADAYVDSHVAWQLDHGMKLVLGGDYLHSGGSARGADFDYHAPLEGREAGKAPVPSELDVRLEDTRDIGGAYVASEWRPMPRVRLDAGLRLNLTREAREAGEDESTHKDKQQIARLSGSVGVMVTAWEQGPDSLRLYANYRNTFKPAAFDFGLGEEGGEGLLKPETAQSFEGGVKGFAFRGQLSAEVSAFVMDLDNLVIARTVNGLPALMNAGKERFKGIETAVSWYLPGHLSGRAGYSFHDARFRDFVMEFDPGIPSQLAGKRLEMSARHLATAGLTYAPSAGLNATFELNYVGSRFLNKRNSALADGYVDLSAGIGYRLERWELRLRAANLSDTRPPVSESELGDAQYYRLPARRFDATLLFHF